jgi:hypothetical protein
MDAHLLSAKMSIDDLYNKAVRNGFYPSMQSCFAESRFEIEEALNLA